MEVTVSLQVKNTSLLKQLNILESSRVERGQPREASKYEAVASRVSRFASRSASRPRRGGVTVAPRHVMVDPALDIPSNIG